MSYRGRPPAPRPGVPFQPPGRRASLPGGRPDVPLAAVLSAGGLVVIALVTLGLFRNQLPFVGPAGGGAAATPAPSNVVNVPEDPRAKVPGTLVYAKAGNVWIQEGGRARQLTSGGADAMPAFAPDGSAVWFVRTREERGLWPAAGSNRYYAMEVPALMRIALEEGARPEPVLDGRIVSRKLRWFAWIRQPAVAPGGGTVALVSDLPKPNQSDVVLQLLDVVTGELSRPRVTEEAPLGHQDPAWRPDGKLLLYVRNARDGARGTPEIWAYDPASGKSRAVTGPGYLHPSWSRDARWIAATKTTAFGTDVVILEAATGAEVLRVTTDGRSWAPVWSPAGDALAFLHAQGQVVDLRLVRLPGTGPAWTPEEPLDLTRLSGLDGGSRPGWFIPAGEIPPLPTPTPAPSAPAPSAS